MKEFENLQNLWGSQKEPKQVVQPQRLIAKAEKQTRAIRSKHIITIAVLAATIGIIISYFLWLGFYRINLFTVGIATMVVMLATRILLEMRSMSKLAAIKPQQDFAHYSGALIRFYQWRKKIHYLITPIIYISYFIGFVMLLPTFKQYLGAGFYTYIIVSGMAVFFALAFFIIKQIKKEMALLEHIKNAMKD